MRTIILAALLLVATQAFTQEGFVSVCDRHPGVKSILMIETNLRCDQIDPADLAGIQKLTVRAKIHELQASDFQGLNGLLRLTLRNSNNAIGEFPKNLFKHLQSLADLWIFNARFTTLPKSEFARLNFLERFEFVESSIGILEPNFFSAMPNLMDLKIPAESLVDQIYPFNNLRTLTITGRSLSHLSKNFFSSLEELKYLSLYRVSLAGAPLAMFSTLNRLIGFALIDADLTPLASGQVAWPKQIGTLYLSFRETAPVLPPGLFDHGSFSINRIEFFSLEPLEHIPDNYFLNINDLKVIDVDDAPLTKTSKSAINGVPRVEGLPTNFGVTETGGTSEEWAP